MKRTIGDWSSQRHHGRKIEGNDELQAKAIPAASLAHP
jgi:hypothetical protein